MSQKRTEVKKAAMLKALDKTLGNIGQAIQQVGISRQTHNRWLKEDAEYADAFHDIKEAKKDFVESKQAELIAGIKDEEGKYIYPPCKTSIIFYLKTQCKDRGYVEKQEIEYTTPIPINEEEIPDLSHLSDEELDRLESLLYGGEGISDASPQEESS